MYIFMTYIVCVFVYMFVCVFVCVCVYNMYTYMCVLHALYSKYLTYLHTKMILIYG